MLNQARQVLKKFHAGNIALFLASAIALTMPASAQTLPAVPKCSATNADCIEKRAVVRGKRGDIYTARADVEYKARDADNALVLKLRTPPPPPPPPHEHTMLPFIDNSKIPAPAVGYATARIQVTTYVMNATNNGTGQFRTECTFSHMNYDDPIVYPGQKGASHLHTYFGNTGANFASTQVSIETTGNSTCNGGTSNRTGYWVPTIIDTKDGTPIKPDGIMIYYKTGYIDGDNVKPFPAGLRMVAGDMKSTGPQTYQNWLCTSATGGKQTSHAGIPADCPAGYTVTASINFPFCWDGKNLDSPDHKSHMSWHVWNGTRSVCPTTHPVELPMITENIKYKVTEGTPRWRLSSDNYGTDKPGGFSLHGDWFNGWDAKVQALWVKNCLQGNKDCHVDLLGDGTKLF
jgi:hypothetical protein